VVTRLLIAINVVVFVLGRASGAQHVILEAWGMQPRLLTAVFTEHYPPLLPLLTVLVSMFLHAGWVHLIGNMWYLWIFGDNVEDRFGHAGFLAFYLAGGAASAAMHTAILPGSTTPTIGASGAIAAVLGAYALLWPRARVVTLVPIFFFLQVVALPALIVLGLWFVMQLFSGVFAGGGGIAWWAHVGGFVFGMIVALAAEGGRRSRAWIEN
jgi:membrane associated rhomboid family serine protease